MDISRTIGGLALMKLIFHAEGQLSEMGEVLDSAIAVLKRVAGLEDEALTVLDYYGTVKTDMAERVCRLLETIYAVDSQEM